MQEILDSIYSKIESFKKICEDCNAINRTGNLDLSELKFDADPITDIMSILFARQVSPVSYTYVDGIKSMYTIELMVIGEKIVTKYHRVIETSEIPEQLKLQFKDWLFHNKEMKLRIKGKRWREDNENSTISSIRNDFRKDMRRLYQLLTELYRVIEINHIHLLVSKPLVFDEKLLAYKTPEGLRKQFEEFIAASDK